MLNMTHRKKDIWNIPRFINSSAVQEEKLVRKNEKEPPEGEKEIEDMESQKDRDVENKDCDGPIYTINTMNNMDD